MEQKMSVFSAKKVEKSQEQLQIKAAILASYSQVGVPKLKSRTGGSGSIYRPGCTFCAQESHMKSYEKER
jgi:hypothetical protein